jgi:hypothetical protein
MKAAEKKQELETYLAEQEAKNERQKGFQYGRKGFPLQIKWNSVWLEGFVDGAVQQALRA